MSGLNSALYYINMFGICILFTLGIMVGVLYYLLKVKKVSAKVEKIDNSSFRRADASTYVPIRDIIYDGDGGLDAPGMIALSDTEFVAGISVRGFDYQAASSGERVDAQLHSVSFFNVVEHPTSFRQAVKSVDLSSNIEEYEEVCKNISMELMELDVEYQSTLVKVEDYLDEPEMYEMYTSRLDDLQRTIGSKRHILSECQNIVRYMQSMSGDLSNKRDAIGETTSQIMFSYTYNSANHSTELSKEEIYEEAMRELKATAQSYTEALARCHFRGKRLTARELIGLIRKQTCPVTGEDFELSELLDSSYTSLFVSSDSLVEACREKLGDDEYEARLQEYEKRVVDKIKSQSLDMEREENIMKEKAMQQARYEMNGGMA